MILVFSVLFMCSFLPVVYTSHYGKMINIAGQAGLGAGIFLFFALRGKRRPK